VPDSKPWALYESELFLWGERPETLRVWMKALSPDDLRKNRRAVDLIPPSTSGSTTTSPETDSVTRSVRSVDGD
jgi:hypothetical protein